MSIQAFPRVAAPAPDFYEDAVMPDKTFQKIRLSDYKGKWVVFFW